MSIVLGIRTASSVLQGKIAGQDNAIKQRKTATRIFGSRLASRTKHVAAKSIAAIPAQSMPPIGVAVLAGMSCMRLVRTSTLVSIYPGITSRVELTWQYPITTKLNEVYRCKRQATEREKQQMS